MTASPCARRGSRRRRPALDVVIDPGQAFGTGAHATTRLCLELMLERPAPRGSFVDLGCGSGVLAIVAAKLGCAPVIALDYDPAAVAATRANAAANGVELEGPAFRSAAEQVPECDLVAANVLAPPLRAWAASQRRLAPELILSGLLAQEADGVAAAFAARGLRERDAGRGASGRALLPRAAERRVDKPGAANLVHAAHAGSGRDAHPLPASLVITDPEPNS